MSWRVLSGTKLWDQIAAELERDRRNRQIAELDQYMQKQTRQIFEPFKKSIVEFQFDGLDIDDLFIAKQSTALEGSTPMANWASRHYNGGNSKLMNILHMAEGREKQRKIKEFGDKILLEGSYRYFEQLSHTCNVISEYIGHAVHQCIARRNARIERYAKNPKAEIQNQLQRLKNLKKLFA